MYNFKKEIPLSHCLLYVMVMGQELCVCGVELHYSGAELHFKFYLCVSRKDETIDRSEGLAYFLLPNLYLRMI